MARRSAVLLGSLVTLGVISSCAGTREEVGSPSLLALVWRNGHHNLAVLDPASLRQRAVLRRFPGNSQPVESPNRKVLAYASQRSLYLVDMHDRRIHATLRGVGLGGRYVRPLSWPEPNRLLAVEEFEIPGETFGVRLVVVNPARERVVARRTLPGPVQIGVLQDKRIAAFGTPARGIQRARIFLIDPSGSRIIVLRRIRVGNVGAGGRAEQVLGPGFAFDQRRQRAFVIGPNRVVVDVNLQTQRVRYHRVAGLVPRGVRRFAEAPVVPGSVAPQVGASRDAFWLGHGVIAVTGSNYFVKRVRYVHAKAGWFKLDQPELAEIQAPAGLTLLDTRTWTARTIDPRAGYLVVGAGLAFVAQRDGITAYGRDGRRRLQLQGKHLWPVSVLGGRLYASTGNRLLAFDLPSGRLLATRQLGDIEDTDELFLWRGAR